MRDYKKKPPRQDYLHTRLSVYKAEKASSREWQDVMQRQALLRELRAEITLLDQCMQTAHQKYLASEESGD